METMTALMGILWFASDGCFDWLQPKPSRQGERNKMRKADFMFKLTPFCNGFDNLDCVWPPSDSDGYLGFEDGSLGRLQALRVKIAEQADQSMRNEEQQHWGQ